MPKLLGPLFSVQAHGTLGGCLTYRRQKMGGNVFPHKVPRLPNTEAQLGQQASVASCVSCWKALPPADKVRFEMKARGLKRTGYHYYMENCLRGLL